MRGGDNQVVVVVLAVLTAVGDIMLAGSGEGIFRRQGYDYAFTATSGSLAQISLAFRIARIARLVALHVPANQSPTPFLLPGPFQTTWRGFLKLDVSETVRFEAFGTGSATVKVNGRDYDLRVSFMPTVHGEKIVLRVLDKSNLSATMEKLGMDQDTFRRFASAVAAPHGLLLVTGPTGSGKTTTLHSGVGFINTVDMKIWTAEDPVEITQRGLRQVQVNPKIDWTFAKAWLSKELKEGR